jgi:hypothetical protein
MVSGTDCPVCDEVSGQVRRRSTLMGRALTLFGDSPMGGRGPGGYAAGTSPWEGARDPPEPL